MTAHFCVQLCFAAGSVFFSAWEDVKSSHVLQTLAEVKAGSAHFERMGKCKKLPACAKLSCFADFGGSEGGLSPLMVSEKLA